MKGFEIRDETVGVRITTIYYTSAILWALYTGYVSEDSWEKTDAVQSNGKIRDIMLKQLVD